MLDEDSEIARSHNRTRQAQRESFRRVSETCPNVDAAFNDVLDTASELLRNKMDEFKNELYAASISHREEMKNKTTYRFRESLQESLEETIKTQEDLSAAQAEIDELRSENTRLIQQITNLQTVMARPVSLDWEMTA